MNNNSLPLSFKGMAVAMPEVIKALNNTQYRVICLNRLVLHELFLGARPHNIRAYSNPTSELVRIEAVGACGEPLRIVVSKRCFRQLILPDYGRPNTKFYYLYSD